MYKGYPICLEEEDGTVSVLRLTLERLEEIRLHEEVLPDMFRKICKAICEEGVLQDPIFIDKKSKVILDGMHRAAALLKLKYGECRELFWEEQKKEYTYPECQTCKGKFKNLDYILCCSADYEKTKAVNLKKWYRGVVFPLEKLINLLEMYDIKETSEEEAFTLLDKDAFTILTDGRRFFSISGGFKNILEKYMALRDIEDLIKENEGKIIYCADEEAFLRLKRGEFSFIMVTPTITKRDVQTFSVNGLPKKGEVFPPKSTRHKLSARPLKVNIPLRLLEGGDYSLKQEQLKVFLRRKRKLTITGRLEQYLEKDKILFGEPGELKEIRHQPHLWACEFPLEFYQIKYDVDGFTDDVSTHLIQNGMELDYAALIRETNRLLLIISEVGDVERTEKLLSTLMKTHFPHYSVKNLFGQREDQTPVWMVPMEDYTPSRAYFERNERLLRKLVKTHQALLCEGEFQKSLEKEKIEELRSYSSEDMLVLFAFHVLGRATRCKVFEYLHENIDDHELVFSRIDILTSQGLIENGVTLSEKGKEVIGSALTVTRDVSSWFREHANTFTEFLEEIDANVSHVIRPDGRKDEFHVGSIMESLIFTDMGWKKVSDVLDRVAEELDSVEFASSDELTSFVHDYLEEEYPLTNIPFRYDYFINSRNYIFLKDEKVISLSRHYIEEDLTRFIPSFLEITASQKSQLSNMVYEGIRLLTIPLIKELYEKERIAIEKDFFSRIEEFIVFQAVPVLKKLKDRDKDKDRDYIISILRESLEKARGDITISSELFSRHDTEFLKYYIMAMDGLTESLSVALGKVPFFDVFGKLSQLSKVTRDSSAEAVFFSQNDAGRYLRHVGHVVRRSTSLLDHWRSLHRDHKEGFEESMVKAWESHLSDVLKLVDRSLKALV